MERFLTIFADASFCSNTGAAGWAAWIKGDGPYRTVSGQFEPSPPDNNVAELWALACAVQQAQADIPSCDLVMLQSDCHGALQPLYSIGFKDCPRDSKVMRIEYPNGLRENYKEAVAEIDRLVGTKTRLMRHVKGHTGNGRGRYWVNEICDRLAKEQMRKSREEIRRERRQA